MPFEEVHQLRRARERLQRKELAKKSDRELLDIWRIKPARTRTVGKSEFAPSPERLKLEHAAMREWQNRDPLERARPGGGGLFSGITRPLRSAARSITRTIAENPAPVFAAFALPLLAPAVTTAVGPTLANTIVPVAKGVKAVSLLSQISSFSSTVSPILQGLGAITGKSGLAKAGNITAVLGGGAPVLPGAGPVSFAAGMSKLPQIGREAAKVIGGGAAGAGITGLFGGGPKKRRRMNPLNAKAARRAIRRIKAVRKITRDIERSLPTRTVRRSSPVAGHRARLSHK